MSTAPVFVVTDAPLLGVDEVVLEGAEAHHAVKVRRLRTGERVDVVDGAGVRAECVVHAVRDRSLVLTVNRSFTEPEPALRVIVVQALVKGGRDEEALAALTELGVDEVWPWEADRGVVKWTGERGRGALRRWNSIAIEAAKQARRARFPVIGELMTTTELAAFVVDKLVVVLHETAKTSLAKVKLPKVGEVVLVVGPEGGVSEAELAALTDAGAVAVRMGPTVLRSATAAAAGAAAVLAKARW